MILLDLNGKWLMRRTGEEAFIDALVPGSMYNDLLTSGKMEDPFYRDNEYEALELSNYDYEYTRNYQIDNKFLDKDKIVLVCEGLDTLAEIFINGKSIGKSNNMHRTYEFNVKELLVVGVNTINIVFESPLQYINKKQIDDPLNGDYIHGIPHLRKAHHMFGWDWGPKLPDVGIWKNISIKAYNQGKIDDVYISQIHEQGFAHVNVFVKLEKFYDFKSDVMIKLISPEGICIEKKISSCLIENNINISVENPLLWWPNGFGAHPLYKVEVLLLYNDIVLDSLSYKIGLRTITVHQEKDQWGESFAFEVNGVQLFSMGADYIPEDNITARCSREKTEKLIRNCIASNFNSIRVWGGAYYPLDYFYDLCDEYGLIVWQDHMYACCVYRFTDDFKENIIQETKDNMRRLRHHASLGLWCGNNELEVGWADWGWSEQFSAALKADYIKHFEVVLPEVSKEMDPNTFYWVASPSSTGSFDNPNDDNYGDMHYWGVWHGREPFTAFRNYFPRFMSEFGLQSFPCLKTIKSFTLPGDRNIFSYVMESHQKSGTGNEKILYYIGENYKYPKDFDSLLYASQLIQAEGIRYGVEHWRRNRGRCMGAMYWQLNDCWPVASWASIDYFGRWKALQYAARKFFSPILISACEEGPIVSLHLSNETMKKVSGDIVWKLRDAKSNIIESFKENIKIDALTSIKYADLDFNMILDSNDKKRNCYLEFKFIIDGKIISDGTVLFVKSKHFNFIDPKLDINIIENDNSFTLDISCKSYAKFVEIDFTEIDAIFSDNYFDLSAGTIKTIQVKKDDLSSLVSIEELRKQLKIRSVFDTFE
ncbi:glycosyl hydrolase 2 galactose-binding domain-containing protein [uncultured Clostridium sp.]|uniref:beta-mannosidase n=1 Tax=uncultured Clostridium sp. TaxID=59620 RepID=UPI0026369E4D|nr:glycoside hydrolase family 2 protein [uncultured Clostridium sp.]